MIDFQTSPDRYRHWMIAVEGPVATLTMDVAEDAGLVPGYDLKLNSYDLGVDIELYDAVQRLRFEHPDVRAVLVVSAKDRVFCAGANIAMLGQSSHAAKVNFCKFTNETRLAIEDASEQSNHTYISVINGTAAGGGYELALATDYIILVDDGSSAVSLPEAPLLAVLPGTGGLTRVVDKRRVRRDRADFFCTVTEGVRGKRALDWNLVDELAPRSRLMDAAREKAATFIDDAVEPRTGIALPPLERTITESDIHYGALDITLDRARGVAAMTVRGPGTAPPIDIAAILAQGAAFWPLALARDLDDAILHLRANEPTLGVWVLRSEGDIDAVAAADRALLDNADHWFARETALYLKRVLKRLDVSSRSLIALIEPGSCFAGTLLELVLAADQSYMLDGAFEDSNLPPAVLRPTDVNFGLLPMGNGLSRLQSRFLDDADSVAAVHAQTGADLDALAAEELGLVTFAPDDIDWEDEVRLAVEGRTAMSPDALTGLEASLRFAGPETMETKIFARLTAWQNWIFQRPNAVGEDGALALFGTGRQPPFDRNRV
ncbi:MAG: benzoyl-CoA-dihydrodiol lyase [Rhodospirillaceae bacterium]|jgi:benzoyl-CoA-dihydrodiol lyase|nr:benzoyl-CoA-dihydrodiol lyase [Rhodospirillaceae bacterium]